MTWLCEQHEKLKISKVVRHMLHIQKSMLYLYTSNTPIRIKISKVLITTAPNYTKYLLINLSTHEQDLSGHNN